MFLTAELRKFDALPFGPESGFINPHDFKREFQRAGFGLLIVQNTVAKILHLTHHALKEQGFRVEMDLRNEKIGFKIREHTLARVPYLLVVGDREMENGTVAVRTRSGEDLGTMSLEELGRRLQEEASRYSN